MADGTNPLSLDCIDCGAAMTEVEITYYEYRCERCERAWCDAVERDRDAEDQNTGLRQGTGDV